MNTAPSFRMVYGQDDRVAEWVRTRAPHAEPGFEKYVAIGVNDEIPNFKLSSQLQLTEEARAHHQGWINDFFGTKVDLVAGVVYNEYRGHSMHVSMASSTPRWATKRTLRELFSYPFVQLKVKRLTAYTGRSMTSVQAFLERLGFQFEGIARQGFEDDDCVIYGMLRSECRWIRSRRYEKQPEPAACA